MSDINQNLKLDSIVEIASSVENTPELKSYWENRYKDLLQRGLFILSEKTADLLFDEELITKPATPFGDIVLYKHIDNNNLLDEIALQGTIETAVRLLDSLVDGIKFDNTSKDIVNQYRKIGLGIAEFKEYLNLRKNPSELDEIDHIGHLVSQGAYRASENLAEEKGVCKNWHLIHKHLRPKSFEYWYNSESGDIKNGLELSQDLDQDSVESSFFQIIPRRNSNILLFPKDLEWQIWSDRDNTSATTKIISENVADSGIDKISENPIPILPDLEEPKLEQEAVENGLVDEDTKNTIDDNYKDQDNTQMFEDTETPVNNFDSKPEDLGFTQDEDNKPDLNLPDMHKANEFLESLSPDMSTPSTDIEVKSSDLYDSEMADGQVETNATDGDLSIGEEIEPVHNLEDDAFDGSKEEKVEYLSEPEHQDEQNIESTMLIDDKSDEAEIDPMIPVENVEIGNKFTPDSSFQVGELVEIKDAEDENYGKVFQVIDVHHDGDIYLYRLTGGHSELENKWWPESSIDSVELIDILDKINIDTGYSHTEQPLSINTSVDIHADALIFSGDKLLVEQVNSTYNLLGGLLSFNAVPEESIERVLFEKYGVTGHTVYEIGSSLIFSKDNTPATLHLGYIVEANNIPEREDLVFLDKKTADFQSGIIGAFLEKLKSQHKFNYQNYAITQNVNTALDQLKSESEQNNFNKLQIAMQTKNYTNMPQSKYALKLEQLIKTNAFGDLVVILQYDAEGPKLVAVQNDHLDDELKHLLDTILGIINFALSKKISTEELALQLEIEPQDGITLPINNLLKVIAVSLKQAPSGVHEIDPRSLMEVSSDLVKNTTFDTGANLSQQEESSEMVEMQEPTFTQPVEAPQELDDTQSDDQKPKGFFGHFGN